MNTPPAKKIYTGSDVRALIGAKKARLSSPVKNDPTPSSSSTPIILNCVQNIQDESDDDDIIWLDNDLPISSKDPLSSIPLNVSSHKPSNSQSQDRNSIEPEIIILSSPVQQPQQQSVEKSIIQISTAEESSPSNPLPVNQSSTIITTPKTLQNIKNAETQRRTVEHPRYPRNPVQKLQFQDHLDAVSFYIHHVRGITLRSFDTIESKPPLQISETKCFRIVSYNVLCQTTFENHREMYGHVNRLDYQWEHRWEVLSRELQNIQGDILCLQGIQKSKVSSAYKKLFHDTMHYESFYKGRDAPKGDGCAIYWNPVKFEALERIPINLNFEVNNLDRSNVAQVCRFRYIETGKELIVVNCHLLFDPNRGDIKIYQLAVIIAHIQKARTKNEPIIFCGDFNISPNSIIYKFIMEGELYCRKTYCVPKAMSGQQHKFDGKAMQCFSIPKESKVTNDCRIIDRIQTQTESLTTLEHKVCFESVYSHYTFNKEKEVSAYGFLYNFNSDYIFYTVEKKEVLENKNKIVEESGLFLHRRLSLPSAKTMEQFCGPLPYYASGSDHLLLCAEFYLN